MKANDVAVLASLELEHPLMNAAGTCKTIEDVERFARSAVSAIVVGSVTCAPRPGNPGTTFWAGPSYSLNSLGLPNQGIEYYQRHLPRMREISDEAGKPLVISLAGFTADEYAEMAGVVIDADLIELNLACPNVWEGGQQKRLACFDLDQTERVCRAVDQAVRDAGKHRGRRPRFGVKISPFSDPTGLAALAGRLKEIAAELDGLRFLVAVNTFPNGYALAGDGRHVIDVGLAGVSGQALKPIGLGQVKQLREILPPSIDLIGVGGITQGRDVHDYLDVGASAVQAATAYWNGNENPKVFSEILTEYLHERDDGD
jgi:dihydroorotate dehydrogenase (fumarate)